NGDGHTDILFGSYNEHVYALRGDTLQSIWTNPYHQCTTCDIRNDPTGFRVGDTISAGPGVADFDRDGMLEMIIGVTTHCYPDATPADGSASSPTPYPDNSFIIPFNTQPGGAMLPLNHDATLLMNHFVESYDALDYCPSCASRDAHLFRNQFNQIISSSPAIADLTGDGAYDYVVGTGIFDGAGYGGDQGLHGFDGSGNRLFYVPTEDHCHASPALGDLDGDGTLEAVAYCGQGKSGPFEEPTNQQLIAVHRDGTLLPGFPVRPTDFFGANINYFFASPVLADLDGDGGLEIIVTLNRTVRTYRILRSGTTATGVEVADDLSYEADGLIRASVAVGDIDNDGVIDIAVPTYESSSFYALSGGPRSATRGWPMFKGDAAGTALFDNVAPARVTDLVATGRAESAVTLKFTAPGDDSDYFGPAETYEIRYSPSPLVPESFADATLVTEPIPAPKRAGEPETVDLVGPFAPGVYFALVAIDSDGNRSAVSVSAQVSPQVPALGAAIALVLLTAALHAWRRRAAAARQGP
ncbi:MAG: VCBS repeat-containing protein, partial [Candidatus Schekmanbacteria bacterium]|nr:VCBS repeat-containing protein [Candidatus Schekmanbacteria bacterium]